MNAFLCMVALMSPHRPPEIVGKVVTRLEVYRTDKTEHCFEETKRIGWTWIEDELLSMREVPLENCSGLL